MVEPHPMFGVYTLVRALGDRVIVVSGQTTLVAVWDVYTCVHTLRTGVSTVSGRTTLVVSMGFHTMARTLRTGVGTVSGRTTLIVFVESYSGPRFGDQRRHAEWTNHTRCIDRCLYSDSHFGDRSWRVEWTKHNHCAGVHAPVLGSGLLAVSHSYLGLVLSPLIMDENLSR